MEGQNLTGGDTDRGYNLRSQGPATLGVEALDNITDAVELEYMSSLQNFTVHSVTF